MKTIIFFMTFNPKSIASSNVISSLYSVFKYELAAKLLVPLQIIKLGK